MKAGAANLAGPALDMAQGATAMQAATNALKSAALDKLLGPAAAFTGLLSGSLLVLRKVVRESQILEKGLVRISRLQQIEGKFETLLKSTTAAKQRIKELYDFTAKSPFRFEDVAEANRTLEALTYGAMSGAKAMKLVGDAAAATGQNITEAADKFGRLANAINSGRSLDRIVLQLQYSGLASEELIASFERLEAAGAGSGEMMGALVKYMERFAGGMDNELQTLDALNTKLEESRGMMQKAFAEPFVEAQANAIKVMTKATQNLTPVIGQVGQDLALVEGFFVDLKTSILDATLAAPGMADALSAAWTAVKVLWTGLALITAASFAKSVGGFLAMTKGAWAAAAATMAAAKASAAGAAAAHSLAVAKRAAALGYYQLAAAQAFSYVKFQALNAVMAVHAGALSWVGKSTGIAAGFNYLLGSSATLAGGALKLLGKAATFVGAQLKATVVALGVVGALWTVAVGLAVAFVAIKRGADEVEKKFNQLSDAAAEATKPAAEPKKPGFLGRLLEKAQKPL
jgi:hypothetical protein